MFSKKEKVFFDTENKKLIVQFSKSQMTYNFSEIIGYKIYASGSTTTKEDLERRLDSSNNYLAYMSFLSLWIEFQLSSGETEKINFFQTPTSTDERERRKFVKEALQTADSFDKLLASKK